MPHRMLSLFTLVFTLVFTLAALILPAQSPLAGLPSLTPNANNRMVSPENPTGRKGQGAIA
jgi:hypothetical protein